MQQIEEKEEREQRDEKEEEKIKHLLVLCGDILKQNKELAISALTLNKWNVEACANWIYDDPEQAFTSAAVNVEKIKHISSHELSRFTMLPILSAPSLVDFRDVDMIETPNKRIKFMNHETINEIKEEKKQEKEEEFLSVAIQNFETKFKEIVISVRSLNSDMGNEAIILLLGDLQILHMKVVDNAINKAVCINRRLQLQLEYQAEEALKQSLNMEHMIQSLIKEKEEALSQLTVSHFHTSEIMKQKQEELKRKQESEFSIIRLELEAKAIEERRLKREEIDTLQAELANISMKQLPEELKAMTSNHFVSIDLLPTLHYDPNNCGDAHFRLAESQFLRMCGTESASYRVTKVRYCIAPFLIRRYNAFRQKIMSEGEEIKELLMFHGTKHDVIDKITKEGFKIGGQGVAVATGTVHGQGVYTSQSPSIAIRYIKDGHTELLFTRVLLTSDTFVHPSNGQIIQQLVSKNIDQLLPCYVVHFSKR